MGRRHGPSTTLLETVIGSRAWGMATEDSDRDVFRLRLEPTRAVLDGTARMRSRHRDETGDAGPLDVHDHEAGHVVQQLIRGNWNFHEHVLAPEVREATDAGRALRDLVATQWSLAILPSVEGMVQHNLKRHRTDPDGERIAAKMLRVLEAAIRVLEGDGLTFEPVGETVPWARVEEGLARLSEAAGGSTLPERPDEEAYRDWLLEARLVRLQR